MQNNRLLSECTSSHHQNL